MPFGQNIPGIEGFVLLPSTNSRFLPQQQVLAKQRYNQIVVRASWQLKLDEETRAARLKTRIESGGLKCV